MVRSCDGVARVPSSIQLWHEGKQSCKMSGYPPAPRGEHVPAGQPQSQRKWMHMPAPHVSRIWPSRPAGTWAPLWLPQPHQQKVS